MGKFEELRYPVPYCIFNEEHQLLFVYFVKYKCSSVRVQVQKYGVLSESNANCQIKPLKSTAARRCLLCFARDMVSPIHGT
jgi:hypothetical protein